MDAEEAARKLLSTKLLPWEHEQEVRVLTYDDFVYVDVVEIVFGTKTSVRDRKLLRKLAKRLGIPKTRDKGVRS